MLRSAVIVPLATLTLSSIAGAQSATLLMSHNHATGLVQPGETIRITHTMSWTGATSLARVVGSSIASPNSGVAFANTGVAGGFSAPPQFGVPSGGSIVGVDLQAVPQFFLGAPTPYGNSTGVPFLWYDWTAPSTPGTIDFNWVPHPDFPTPLFYLTFLTEVRSPLPTAYLGTSITVIPAPAAGLTLLAFATLVRTPRRR